MSLRDWSTPALLVLWALMSAAILWLLAVLAMTDTQAARALPPVPAPTSWSAHHDAASPLRQ